MERTIYWSHFKDYRNCPQKYLWNKGWPGIDLGAGPGQPKPKPDEKRTEHHAVMGIAVQAALEWFYNKQIWADPDMRDPGRLRRRLVGQARKEFALALRRADYIDWDRAPSPEDMEQVCINGVLGYMKTMKAHRLLSGDARSEVSTFGFLDKWTRVGGRIDFVIPRGRGEEREIILLDGKNSKHKDKYLDTDQLLYYALCYHASWHEIPDRLGWVYYRYPHDGEEEEGVHWVPFNEGDLRRLKAEIIDARKSMEREVFPAQPAPKHCQFCDYEPVCEARQAQRKANAAKRKASREKKRKELREKIEQGEKKGSLYIFGLD